MKNNNFIFHKVYNNTHKVLLQYATILILEIETRNLSNKNS